MTKNKLKAKQRILNSRASGEVIMDVLKMYYLMINKDNPMVDPQILKNVIILVKKSYLTELNGCPEEGVVKQIDLEDSIKELKEKYQEK